MDPAVLSKDSRKEAIEKMAGGEEFDVLVIGGGVTGAGIALDAATRGLKVAIVEAQDWSSGTSSRSSKLVHGGLRYLYQLDFPLVAEALRERGLLLEQNAPHLVKKQPLLWPLKTPLIERSYSAVGVGLYDVLAQWAHRGAVPIQRHYTKRGSLKLAPALSPKALTGSIVYYDAKVDDARLVVTLVRTAVRYGAVAANRVELVGVVENPDGRVVGAQLLDLEDMRPFSIRTKRIINATGVWTEQTEALAKGEEGLRVLASKGIHIVVPRDRIDSQVGLFLRTDKSVLFMIPWKRHWLIGTTDTPFTGQLREPVADETDIDYLLAEANKVLAHPLTRDDVIGTFAGLRPLLQPHRGDKKSTKVSREHTVTEVAPGMTVIAGGKLTTYRQMAQDAVDFALGEYLAKQMPSITDRTPLEGASGYFALENMKESLAFEHGFTVDQIEDLLDRYGSDIYLIFDMVREREELGERLEGAPEYLKADVVFAVTHEGALHIEDIMDRRVRLSYNKADAGLTSLDQVADLAAQYLGWDEEQKEHEKESYRSVCEAVWQAQKIRLEPQAQAVRESVTPIKPFLTV